MHYKLSGEIDAQGNEDLLCDLGTKGWKLLEVHKIINNCFYYLEKEVIEKSEDERIMYQYKITRMNIDSKLSWQPSIPRNESLLTGLGLIGWKLNQIFNITNSNHYYIFEKPI